MRRVTAALQGSSRTRLTVVLLVQIAAGLCKALVKSPRANDALLLMTVLSTSLKTLARRGYNVERIQASRRAEREAADQRMREERARAAEKAATELVSCVSLPETYATQYRQIFCVQSSEKLSAYANQMQELFPDADPEYLVRLLMQQKTEHVINASNALLSQGDYPRRPVNSSPTKLGSADPPAYQQTRRPDNASSTAVARSAANLGPDPPLRPSSSSSSIASPALPSSKSDKGLFETFRRFGRSQTRVTEEQASIAGPSPIAGGSGNGSNGRPPQLPEHMRPTSSPGPTPTSSAAIRDNVRKAIEVSDGSDWVSDLARVTHLGCSVSRRPNPSMARQSQARLTKRQCARVSRHTATLPPDQTCRTCKILLGCDSTSRRTYQTSECETSKHDDMIEIVHGDCLFLTGTHSWLRIKLLSRAGCRSSSSPLAKFSHSTHAPLTCFTTRADRECCSCIICGSMLNGPRWTQIDGVQSQWQLVLELAILPRLARRRSGTR